MCKEGRCISYREYSVGPARPRVHKSYFVDARVGFTSPVDIFLYLYIYINICIRTTDPPAKPSVRLGELTLPKLTFSPIRTHTHIYNNIYKP